MVNGWIQSGAHEGLVKHLLEALEDVRTLAATAVSHAENLFALLERLAELHRKGDLSDAEFERAKKKVLT